MSNVYDKLTYYNYMIGIPSRKREFMVEKKTGVWKYFAKDKSFSYNLYLIVRESESKKYYDKLMDVIKQNEKFKCSITSVPDSHSIAQKRQGLLFLATKYNYEYLFIIDDDIDFYFREESLSSKYTNRYQDLMEKDVVNKILYESMRLCDDEYPVVGLPLKQGSQNRKYTFEKNVPVIRFVCYHVPTLVKEKIEVTGLNTTFMSDRYVQLELLSRGYRSITNCRYAIGDLGTGYKGGCSETRTVELQNKAANNLCEKFPKYVKLKIKENGLWNEKRWDCKINWKGFLNKDEIKYIPKEEVFKKYGI